MRTSVVLLLLLMITLVFFNPDMEEFKVFVEKQSKGLLQEQVVGSPFGEALSGIGSRLAGSYIDRVTERENYVFFSIYTIDLDGKGKSENEWRFLGIEGTFFEVKRPSALSR